MKITRQLITASACALLGSTALVHATERAPLQDTSDSWLRLAQVAVDCEAQPEAAECLQRTREAEEEDQNRGEAAPDGNQPSQEAEPEAPEEGEAQSGVAPEAAEPEPAVEEPEAAEEEAPPPQAAPAEEEEATEAAPAAEDEATEDEADDETQPPAAGPAPAPEPEAADEVSEPDEVTPDTNEEAPVEPDVEQTREEEAAPAEAPAGEEEEAAPETDAGDAAEGEGAPILDSQKRSDRGDGDDRRGERDRDGQRFERDRQPAQAEAPAEAEETPNSDSEAQVEIEAEVESITREEGRRIERPSWSERRGDGDGERSGDRDDRRGERDRDDRRGDREDRRESRDRGEDFGRVVREFGDRVIIQLGDQIRVERRDRDRRLERNASDVYYEELSNGRTREVVERRNGVQVITIRDRYGDILHRARVYPDGREVVLFHVNPRNYERLHDHRRAGWDLPPMRLTIPVDEYILEARRVRDREAYYEFLRQSPVERVERTYSVAEVTQSPRIRDKARRIDLDTINFDFNSATIAGSEINKLDDVAWAIAKLLKENPGETFLIEGHTDAVGSDLYNLALSDQRADAVVDAMVNYYELPPENFIAQGYGEQYLKVDTEARNRENRRVAIRRITPLVAPVAQAR